MDFPSSWPERAVNAVSSLLSGMPEFFLSYAENLVSRSLSSNTVMAYLADVRDFCLFVCRLEKLDVSSLSVSDLDVLEEVASSFLSSPLPDGSSLSVSSMARKLSSLKSFYTFLSYSGLLGSSPVFSLPAPYVSTKSVPSTLDPSDLSRIVDLAVSGEGLSDTQKRFMKRQHYRDASILSLLFTTGMRLSDLASLDMDDFDEAKGLLSASGHVYTLDTRTRSCLSSYIYTERFDPDRNKVPLFLSRKDSRLSSRSIERVADKYVRRILPGLSCRDIRSSFAASLSSSGLSDKEAAEAMGYKRSVTLQRKQA